MNKIKNPVRLNIVLSLIVSALGILVVCMPMVISELKNYLFYFNYFGIIMIVGGLGFAAYYYFKPYKRFKNFLESDRPKLRLDYSKEELDVFLGELSAVQNKESKKRFLYIFVIIIILSVLLFFSLGDGAKLLALLFFAGFTIVAVGFILVLPNMFQYFARQAPYCSIIGEDEAYIMGKYHRWLKVKAKVKEYDNGVAAFKVLSINYESFTMYGKMFREWNALLPKDNLSEHEKEAREWASKINKLAKVREAEQPKGDILERFFNKMLGRNSDGSEKK